VRGVETDFAVIGGGLVGMAIAWGIARLGRDVTVFDEGDRAFRASRGNFGLVWVQGKGADMPDYARWTRLSASLWPDFAAELAELTGIDVELSQRGGVYPYLSDREAEQAAARLGGLRTALGGDYPFEHIGHNALKAMIPEIGPEVAGAIHTPMDGHVNPLYLLRALHAAFARAGGRLRSGAPVDLIEPVADGYRISRADGAWHARNVLLCAGLGNARLAPMVGLEAPVVPNRGQVLVTERLRRFLPIPTVFVRQVGEGAVQIGDSHEDVGMNDGTRGDVVGAIARRAVRLFPILERVRVVRSWGALRVMSPDGHPVYDRGPGAAVVNCHSGVTLAAAHARVLAGWIARDAVPQGIPHYPDYMEAFSAERFRVQAAG